MMGSSDLMLSTMHRARVKFESETLRVTHRHVNGLARILVEAYGFSTELTGTQSRVFSHLLDHLGSWVSHEQLRLAATTGADIYDSSLIRVHMHKIRRRLASFPLAIVTTRGLGTRLVFDESQVLMQILS